MNWLLLLQAAPLLFKLIPKVREVITETTDNESATKNLRDGLEGGYEILEEIGDQFFPGVLPHLQPVAAATALDPALVKYVQKGLNALMHAGLDEDGQYGALTKAAVKAYQQSRGLTADEWAGEKTRASIAMELAKLK